MVRVALMTGANDTNDSGWVGLILKRKASFFRPRERAKKKCPAGMSLIHLVGDDGAAVDICLWLELGQIDQTKSMLDDDDDATRHDLARNSILKLHFPSIGLIDFFRVCEPGLSRIIWLSRYGRVIN